MTLWTVGYGGASWETFLQVLREAGVQLVLDVRRTAWSESSPCYREAELVRELPRAGIAYERARELGNPPDVAAACTLAGNLEPFVQHLAERPNLVERLLLRLQEAPRVAILCGCPDSARCHRGVIAAACARRGVQVHHLRPRLGAAGPAPKILAITVRQPWAWAICQGHTALVNVLEPPARGAAYLAIHAKKEYDSALHLRMHELGLRLPPRGMHHDHGVVAVARLGGLLREREVPTGPRGGDPWFLGPVGLQLVELVTIQPVPCRGAAGLWKLPPDVLELVRDRWKTARAALCAEAGR